MGPNLPKKQQGQPADLFKTPENLMYQREEKEYHTVEMAPEEELSQPFGKQPLAFFYRMVSENTVQNNEDSFTEIIADLIYELLRNKNGKPYYPMLAMTPAKNAILGTTVPHFPYFRTLYSKCEPLIRSMIVLKGEEEFTRTEVPMPVMHLFMSMEGEIQEGNISVRLCL